MKLPTPEDITYENERGYKALRGFRLTPEWALVSAPNDGYRFVFLPNRLPPSAAERKRERHPPAQRPGQF